MLVAQSALFRFPMVRTARTPRLNGHFPIWGFGTFRQCRGGCDLRSAGLSIFSDTTLCSIFSPRSGSRSASTLGTLAQGILTFGQVNHIQLYGPLNMIALNVRLS